MLRWQAHLLCLSGLRCKISRKVLLYLFRFALKREEAEHSEPACSGIVEPIAGGLTLLFATYLTPVLPYLLAFSAGGNDLRGSRRTDPESAEGEHSNIGTVGFAAGFVLMMILDVALG